MSYTGDNMMDVKRTNRSAVLRILREKGAMSRKRLAETTSLTPAAITKIVAELLREGLLREEGAVASGSAGRREILVALEPGRRCALGVLLNLRQANVSAVRLDGTVIFSRQFELEARAPAENTVRMLAETLRALAAEHGLTREEILGLGVAVRGILSQDGRTLTDSFGALDEADFPLCDRLEALTGLPVHMANNVRALFAAQNFFDRDSAPDSQFFLRCEYGIGASLSVNGQIWQGVSRQCAELGHIPVIRRGGKSCSCGKCGCLETIASPAAIREDALALLSQDGTPLLWRLCQEKAPGALTIDDVLSAAQGGDAAVAAIVDRAVIALGSALKAVIYLADPGRILLYGHMFDHPYFLSRLLSEMQEGVDARHSVVIEKSRYNHQLESCAAGLLAVEDFFLCGGLL